MTETTLTFEQQQRAEALDRARRAYSNKISFGGSLMDGNTPVDYLITLAEFILGEDGDSSDQEDEPDIVKTKATKDEVADALNGKIHRKSGPQMGAHYFNGNVGHGKPVSLVDTAAAVQSHLESSLNENHA